MRSNDAANCSSITATISLRASGRPAFLGFWITEPKLLLNEIFYAVMRWCLRPLDELWLLRSSDVELWSVLGFEAQLKPQLQG
jgi:hypothetical protein